MENYLHRRGQLQVLYTNASNTAFVGYSDKYDEVTFEIENVIYILNAKDIELVRRWEYSDIFDIYDSIKSGEVEPVVSYDADDPYIKQREYDRRNEFTAKTIRINKRLNERFIEKCELLNVSQTDKLDELITEFVESN